MNALQAVILALGIVYQGMDLLNAYERVATGISAKAEAEGREVTPEEFSIIKGLRDEAAAQRRGDRLPPTV